MPQTKTYLIGSGLFATLPTRLAMEYQQRQGRIENVFANRVSHQCVKVLLTKRLTV